MKIGIMTHWWDNDNYGQTLQHYALQQFLIKNGHEPFLIRYIPDREFVFGEKNIPSIRYVFSVGVIRCFKFVFRKIRNAFLRSFSKGKLAGLKKSFASFKDKYIKQSKILYNSYDELRDNPPVADMYITGSDQVWNFSFTNASFESQKKVIHAFFLDFGSDEVKRISVAASFGDISKEQVNFDEIKTVIQKLNYVTVRELNAVEYCAEMDVNAVLIPDTAFFLEADDYRTLYKSCKNRWIDIDYKFILIYRIGDGWTIPFSKIKKEAKKKGLKIINIVTYSETTQEHVYPTVEEWLFLMDKAECIITNSYHGCVFAKIFEKELIFARNYQENCRVDTLLKCDMNSMKRKIEMLKSWIY